MTTTLSVSTFFNRGDNAPKQADAAWPDDFLEFDYREDKHAGPLWSPVTYIPGGRRANPNVTGVTALVLDLDTKDGRPVPNIEEVALAFADFEFVLHTSYSHTPETPSFRVILPLAEPVTVLQHAALWKWAEARCLPARMDPACKDPARMYYSPTAAPGAKSLAVHWEGTRRLSTADAPADSAPPAQTRDAAYSAGRFKGIRRIIAQVEDLPTIEEKCAFMRHYRDDIGRGTDDPLRLSEPEWYAALSIVARCKDGDTIAMSRHRPSDNYGSDAEHAAKYERAKNVGPATCRHIKELSDACRGCPLAITSPVLLGRIQDPAASTPAASGPVDPGENGSTSYAERATAWRQNMEAELAAASEAEAAARQAKLEAVAALKQAKVHATADEVTRLAATVAAAEAELRAAKELAKQAERNLKKAASAEASTKAPPNTPDNADPEVWSKLSFNVKEGRPHGSRGNVRIILENDPIYADKFTFDVFSRRVMYFGAPAADGMDTEIATDLEYRYRLITDTKIIGEVAYFLAKEHAFHPVQDYLKSLTWDGVDRMTDIFFEVFDASVPEQHLDFYRSAARKFFINCVARIFEPGVKMDYMLVLGGKQYAGKSWSIRRLVSPPCAPKHGWFTDTKIDISNRDAFLQIAGNWFVEIPEMDSLKKAENTAQKAFLSSQVDRYRPPYGHHVVETPRDSVFIGTTNQEEFLADVTGSRRFLVVWVQNEVDVAWIEENRDQLWAEAYAAYMAGEDYKLTSEDVAKVNEVNEDYREHDAWEPIVQDFILRNQMTRITITDVLVRALDINIGNVTKIHRNRAAEVLRALKCEPVLLHGAGKRVRSWVVPASLTSSFRVRRQEGSEEEPTPISRSNRCV
jgi:predicted P-loop ATPase